MSITTDLSMIMSSSSTEFKSELREVKYIDNFEYTNLILIYLEL